MDDGTQRRFYHANFQRYIIAGLLTITPLFAVWLVFNFFLNTLSFFGQPLAVPLTEFLDQNMPAVRPWIGNATVRWLMAVIVAVLALYFIGAIASRVIGQQAHPSVRAHHRAHPAGGDDLFRRQEAGGRVAAAARAATSAWCWSTSRMKV